MDSKRIVLPLPSVTPILKLLHSSHSGITKTTSLARGLYFWPGMTNDTKQLVSRCQECTRVLQSQPCNPMSTSAPSSHFGFPMQHVGLDLFFCREGIPHLCRSLERLPFVPAPPFPDLRSRHKSFIYVVQHAWLLQFAATVAPNFVETSFSSAPSMAFAMSSWHHTTPRAMALPKLE